MLIEGVRNSLVYGASVVAGAIVGVCVFLAACVAWFLLLIVYDELVSALSGGGPAFSVAFWAVLVVYVATGIAVLYLMVRISYRSGIAAGRHLHMYDTPAAAASVIFALLLVVVLAMALASGW